MSELQDLTATPVAAVTPVPLTGRQKAAIVIRLMLDDGAAPSLDNLPEAMQADLARQFVAMGSVDLATVHAVVAELGTAADALGVTFPGDVEAAIDTLGTVISADAAERLRRQAGLTRPRDPWDIVADADIDRLADILDRESDAVGAVMLSKLPVAKAAQVLGHVPGDLARRVALVISRSGDVLPETVDRIGAALADQIATPLAGAFSGAPVARVGEILNAAPSATRDELLEDFANSDPDFARDVRATIFTFADIATRMSPDDIGTLQTTLDQADLTTIFAGATQDDSRSVRFILDNMSRRLADMIRDDAKAMPTPDAAELDAAMSRVVQDVRRLEKAGAIHLLDVNMVDEETPD